MLLYIYSLILCQCFFFNKMLMESNPALVWLTLRPKICAICMIVKPRKHVHCQTKYSFQKECMLKTSLRSNK